MKKRLFLILIFIFFFSYASACADTRTQFEEQIRQFKKEGVIPTGNGRISSFGDYDVSLALLGYVQGVPLMEANNFILSANISWDSSTDRPNTNSGGCGIIFNTAEGSTQHTMVSIRMDGNIYYSGVRNYQYYDFGLFTYGFYTIRGSYDVTLIVANNIASIYLNGQRLASKAELPIDGSLIELAILSGTNQDWGTSCSFKDIFIYSW